MTEGEIVVKEIIKETRAVVNGFLEACSVKAGSTVIVGCSSSEIAGGVIGKNSSEEIGRAVFETIHEMLSEKGIFVAAQCCEHLNRAIILERSAAHGCQEVNAVPYPKAGGSFAAAAYNTLSDPIAVEYIQADAGIDIGDTLIGMHLKPVAVPVRIAQKTIGGANVVCARTRPKLIGGSRTHYNENLMK